MASGLCDPQEVEFTIVTRAVIVTNSGALWNIMGLLRSTQVMQCLYLHYIDLGRLTMTLHNLGRWFYCITVMEHFHQQETNLSRHMHKQVDRR